MDEKTEQFVIAYNGCDKAADILLWPWTPRIHNAICNDSAVVCSLGPSINDQAEFFSLAVFWLTIRVFCNLHANMN